MTITAMTARADTVCRCGSVVAPGETAGWDRAELRVVCLACLEGLAAAC
jgi:hypothetical protein